MCVFSPSKPREGDLPQMIRCEEHREEWAQMTLPSDWETLPCVLALAQRGLKEWKKGQGVKP